MGNKDTHVASMLLRPKGKKYRRWKTLQQLQMPVCRSNNIASLGFLGKKIVLLRQYLLTIFDINSPIYADHPGGELISS